MTDRENDDCEIASIGVIFAFLLGFKEVLVFEVKMY